MGRESRRKLKDFDDADGGPQSLYSEQNEELFGTVKERLPFDLADVLRKPLMRNELREFLRVHLAVENLMFYEAIELFQKIDKHDWRQNAGRQMVVRFVHADGMFSVNLSSDVREQILETRVFCGDTFDEAKREIYCLMQDNFFDKFLSHLVQQSIKNQTSKHEAEVPQEDDSTSHKAPRQRRPSFFKRASASLLRKASFRTNRAREIDTSDLDAVF